MRSRGRRRRVRAGVKAGCEYTGLPHHIMSGYRYNVCHANWTPKQVQRGELVLLELYGCVERYHATQMRTISMGPPSDATKRAAEIVIAAQDAAFAAMRPGASAREDRRARARSRSARSGPNTSTAPAIRPASAFRRERRMGSARFQRAGRLGAQGRDGLPHARARQGFGISETVVVTATGIERLTAANPRELVVK